MSYKTRTKEIKKTNKYQALHRVLCCGWGSFWRLLVKAATLDQDHPVKFWEIIFVSFLKIVQSFVLHFFQSSWAEQGKKHNLLWEEETLVAVGGVGGHTVRVPDGHRYHDGDNDECSFWIGPSGPLWMRWYIEESEPGVCWIWWPSSQILKLWASCEQTKDYDVK